MQATSGEVPSPRSNHCVAMTKRSPSSPAMLTNICTTKTLQQATMNIFFSSRWRRNNNVRLRQQDPSRHQYNTIPTLHRNSSHLQRHLSHMDEIVSAAAPSYMTRILVGDQFLVWDGCDGQKSVEGNRIVYDLSFKKWATNFTASPSLQPQKPLQQKYFNCLAAVIVTILEARLAQVCSYILCCDLFFPFFCSSNTGMHEGLS